jgi:hypothetical protein
MAVNRFHNWYRKFAKSVDCNLRNAGAAVRKTAFRAPNTNAFAERFIRSVEQEALDHFVVLGEQHFNRIVSSWLDYHHTERPHQSKENDLLVPFRRPKKRRPVLRLEEPPKVRDVHCCKRLGGLLKRPRRTARRRPNLRKRSHPS